MMGLSLHLGYGSKTTLGDDMAFAGKEDCRPLHQAPRRRVEWFPAMHREAVVPQ
jgi:hypothetical protein